MSDYVKMVDMLESIKVMTDLVGEENMSDFMTALTKDDSIELIRDCAKIYRKQSNICNYNEYVSKTKTKTEAPKKEQSKES
jgi:hypothetical protein